MITVQIEDTLKTDARLSESEDATRRRDTRLVRFYAIEIDNRVPTLHLRTARKQGRQQNDNRSD